MRKAEKHRRIPALTGLFLLICLLHVPPVLALDGYYTDAFDVEIRANRDNTFEVTEVISVDFPEERHGIYRDIPYKKGKVLIKNISVEGDPYETERISQDGNHVARIKIGEEDRTLTGKKTYTIRYTLTVFDDGDPKQDLLYLDLLPSFWESDIGRANVILTLPEAIDWEKAGIYAGRYGSTASAGKFHVEGKDNVLTATGENISRGEGLTVRSVLPEGYWQDAEENGKGRMLAHPLLIFLLIFFPVVMLCMWHFFGRNKKIVPTVEMYPPRDITPVDVGYILDSSAEKRDFFSLIPYFAAKGYIQIKQFSETRTVLYRMAPLEEVAFAEKPHVAHFYETLFPEDKYELDTEEMARYQKRKNGSEPGGYRRILSYKNAKKSIESEYGKYGFQLYSSKSRKARIAGIFVLALIPVSVILCTGIYIGEMAESGWNAATALLLLGAADCMHIEKQRLGMSRSSKIFLGILSLGMMAGGFAVMYKMLKCYFTLLYLPPAILSFLIALFFQLNMHTRTEESAALIGKLLGLKEFIRVAELDKLKMLAEENPEYFYEILPYAYVFGLTDKWIGKFENIEIGRPSWFSGSESGFYSAAHVTAAVTDSISVFSTVVTTTESSDGSGGGSSGGGFGGGGGGSW